MLIDANPRPGGQAGISSRIVNVIGFPAGATGNRLANEGFEQAERHGAECRMSVRVERIEHGAVKTLHLSDGSTVRTHAIVLAGGVQFPRFEVPGADADGIFYGNEAQIEEDSEPGDPVVIVGGANSAGQAALHLSREGRRVRMLIRSNLRKGMNHRDRARSNPIRTSRSSRGPSSKGFTATTATSRPSR